MRRSIESTPQKNNGSFSDATTAVIRRSPSATTNVASTPSKQHLHRHLRATPHTHRQWPGMQDRTPFIIFGPWLPAAKTITRRHREAQFDRTADSVDPSGEFSPRQCTGVSRVQTVRDAHPARRRGECGFQQIGVRKVSTRRGARGVRRPQLDPAAMLGVQQRGKRRGRIQLRHCPPVDRSVSCHQCDPSAVAQHSVVADLGKAVRVADITHAPLVAHHRILPARGAPPLTFGVAICVVASLSVTRRGGHNQTACQHICMSFFRPTGTRAT